MNVRPQIGRSTTASRSMIAFVVSLALILPYRAQAQDGPYTVRGTVYDQLSGAPITSARIIVLDVVSGDTLVSNARTDARGSYRATTDLLVSADDASLPSRYWVGDVSPNPLPAGPVTLRYATPGNRPETPILEIYDVLGRRVDRARTLSSGVYFYRLRFEDGYVSTAKSFVFVGGGSVALRMEQLTGEKGPASTTAKVGRGARDVQIVVAKSGFRVVEVVRSLTAEGDNVVDFTLERSSASKARLLVAVTNTAGDVLPDVQVDVVDDELTGRTNNAGEVALDSIYTGVPTVLKLTKPGFIEQFKRAEAPPEGGQISLQAVMRQREPTRSIPNAQSGAGESGKDGIRVDIPADALVDEEDNPVTGPVSLNMTPIDVSDEAELGAFPGAFIGFDQTGEQGNLVTFGVAEIAFEQAGRPLNLAPGKTATIELPLYVPRDPDGNLLREGDTVPFWSLDEGTGVWMQEALGTVVNSPDSPTGLAVRAEVTHFSWWNLDKVVETAVAWFQATVGPPLCNLITSGWGRMEGGRCVIPPLGNVPPELMPAPATPVRVTVSTTEPDLPPMRGDTQGSIPGPRPDDGPPPPPPAQPPPPCLNPPCIDIEFPDGALGFPAGREIICEFETGPIPVVEEDPDLGQVVKMKKGKAKKTIVLSPDTSPVIEVEFEVESLETGGDSEILMPPTNVERALEAGGVATFLFESDGQEVLFLDVCRAFGSNIDGTVLLRSPSGLALDLQSVGPDCAIIRTVLRERGVYTIRIDNRGSTSDAYTLGLETARLIDVDSSIQDVLDGEGDSDRFIFEGVAGTLVNAAFGSSEIDGRIDLYLQRLNAAPWRRSLTLNGTFTETGFIEIEEAGLYELAVQAESNVQGAYALGLTLPTPIVPFTIDSSITELSGDLTILGQRRYHSFDGQEGDIINLVIDRTDTGARLSVLSPDQPLDYAFAFERTIAVGDPEYLETGQFALPETGSWLLEIAAKDTGVPLERRTGGYGVTVYKPNVEPLVIDSTYAGAFEGPYIFDVYSFELEEEQTVEIQTTNLSGGFHYTELYGAGARLDRQFAFFQNSTSEINMTLPPGTYTIVHENNRDGLHEYRMVVRLLE